jgi:hypothetical protein
MRSIITATTIFCLAFTGILSAGPFPPDTVYYEVNEPDMSRPGYLESVTDPEFGTEITRVTDSDAFGRSNVRHHYAKDSPWNCDGTRIMIANWILDGKTYEIIKTFQRASECRWSGIDPDIILGVGNGRIVRINVDTDDQEIVYDFSDEYDEIYLGPWEGNFSIDDRYVALQGISSGDCHAIVFDMQERTVLTTKRALDMESGRNDWDWISMSQSGDYVVINWRVWPGDGPVKSYDRNLNFIADIAPQGEHGDIGYDAEGNEVFAQVIPIKMTRLDNGQATSLLSIGRGGHISCRNIKRPGWCYASFSDGEVLALKLDGSETVEMFTHHRATGDSYDANAFAAAGPYGRKIMFASDWSGTSEINSYVVSMPSVDTIPVVLGQGIQPYTLSAPGTEIWFTIRGERIDADGLIRPIRYFSRNHRWFNLKPDLLP